MLLIQPEEISVDIEEVATKRATSGLQGWRVCVRVNDGNGLSLRKERDVSDPLKDRGDHARLRTYLNETLDLSFTRDYTKIEKKLESYPRILFDDLQLDQYSSYLNGKKVNVSIRGIQLRPNTSCGKSIHSLHWELLEDPSLWVGPEKSMSAKPASVTVRRCVKDLHVPGSPRNVTQTGQVGEPELFNVLLVVARTKVHTEETDYFNPTSVLRAILEAQAELECRRSPKRIRLEVVRPGSYDELKIHLERSNKTFQMVHFDVHGDIDSNIGAHLIFNQYAENGNHLVEGVVAASDIAKLLLDHKIRCAVLSSCKTAVADAGIEANLSWSFLQEGMASVLAISYNIPDTMSKIFFPSFYHEIFVNNREFADAAAIAREKLCKSPGRWSYVQKKSIKLKDWFIPKVYSNGEPWYIGKKPNPYFVFWNWINTLVPQLLLIISMLVSSFVNKPLGSSPLVSYIATLMNLDNGASMIWTRRSLSVSCLALLVALMKRHWIKRQFVQRLEMIDRDRKNILRVEGDLRRSHQIFLHTVNDVENTAHTLLDTLSHVWCRTHLVQHRVMIQAEWFLQPFPWDIPIGRDWTLLPRSICHILQLWARGLSPGLAQLSRRGGKEAQTVVVVVNVRALFPGESQEQDYHQNAQIRFRDWLERYFGFEGGDGDGGRGTPSRLPYYLVLIGKGLGDAAKPWLLESLGGVKALERIIVTDYTNPENFEHNLERPLTGRGRL